MHLKERLTCSIQWMTHESLVKRVKELRVLEFVNS